MVVLLAMAVKLIQLKVLDTNVRSVMTLIFAVTVRPKIFIVIIHSLKSEVLIKLQFSSPASTKIITLHKFYKTLLKHYLASISIKPST